MKPNIIDETHPLQEVLVWGEPGCEALLAQLLPKSKSLFFSYYEVREARTEFRRMQTLIEKEGVRVIRAKDAYVRALAKMDIPNLPDSIHELERKLIQRADEYYENFRQEKIAELEDSEFTISIDEIHKQVKADIHKVLQEDVEAYGEMNAVKLNHQLSLTHDFPICNIFYGRDQSNTLGNQIVISSMRWDIRRPETEIYKVALKELGLGEFLVEIKDGTIEGGDAIILGDTCYIGVGARTTMSAVEDLYGKIGENLEKQGIQVVAVVNERHEKESASPAKPTTEHMQVMHLDMFWIPLAGNLVLAGNEIDSRIVLKLTNRNGKVTTEEMGSFRDFIGDKQIELIEVTAQEQKDYAVNLLNFGNNKVLVALSRNKRVIREMESRGFKVIHADLNKLVGGYGAAHCLTAPILRKQ
ncbi:MAG TPA: arginine deiminase family protein [Anaerolineales bacterium]|nr:arginine deiminase family protein [Anaerolineales bacterium]